MDKSVQTRERAEAGTLIGSGKVQQLAGQAHGLEADLVIFDHELTPTQQRNLERALETRVVDRTQLILDIFARRARTREGQLQVELAQLNYLLPRLAGRGVEMSRLGGGIGTRGPGETQLETDRRRIFRRIRKIQGDLERVRAGRSVQRKQRQAAPLATVALVGYTNAGKSTLFNRLTGAEVPADARMFATLDPTVRAVTLPSNRTALVSDTVGFIRNLPTTLVKAFRATLEEVKEAALLLHVVDISSAHARHEIAQVTKVLAEIGAEATPQVLVLNKVDRVGEMPAGMPTQAGMPVPLSALTGQGTAELLAAIDRALPADPVAQVRFRFPVTDFASLSFLHNHARVTACNYTARFCEVEAEAAESVRQRLAKYLVKN